MEFRNCQRVLGTPRPGTEVSRALRARNPKESEKSLKGGPAPGSPRVPKECATESEKSPKRVRSCVFGLFSDSGANFLGTLGPPRGRRPRNTLSDSFRTLLGFRARKARETSVPGRGVPKACRFFFLQRILEVAARQWRHRAKFFGSLSMITLRVPEQALDTVRMSRQRLCMGRRTSTTTQTVKLNYLTPFLPT